MEIATVEDCFKFRLLRSIPKDIGKSKSSLQLASHRLERTKEAVRLGIFDFAILEAYTAMFHAGRAILYRDGIQEKSHYAIFVYLKENYSSKIPLHIINLLNIHRIERHAALYGLEYTPSKEEALTAIGDARRFVAEVNKVLKEDI